MWKRIFESEIWEGKRKFFIVTLVISVAIVFRIMNYIDGHDFAGIIKDVSIAFLGANLVKHVINSVQDYIAIKTTSIERRSNNSDK